jgi:hypothetical protein
MAALFIMSDVRRSIEHRIDGGQGSAAQEANSRVPLSGD